MKKFKKMTLTLNNITHQKFLNVSIDMDKLKENLKNEELGLLSNGTYVKFSTLRDLTLKGSSWFMVLKQEDHEPTEARHIRLVSDWKNEISLIEELKDFFDQTFEKIYHFFLDIVEEKTSKNADLKQIIVPKMKRKM